VVFKVADKCRDAFFCDGIKSWDKHPARLCQPAVQFLDAYFAKQIELSARATVYDLRRKWFLAIGNSWGQHCDLPVEYPQFHAAFDAEIASGPDRGGVVVRNDNLGRLIMSVGTDGVGAIFGHRTVSWKSAALAVVDHGDR
jgi:hypothetical protein